MARNAPSTKAKSTLVKRLQEARHRLGLTQEQAAAKWGINLRTLQGWEYGRNEPRGFALAQLEKLIAEAIDNAPHHRRPKSS